MRVAIYLGRACDADDGGVGDGLGCDGGYDGGDRCMGMPTAGPTAARHGGEEEMAHEVVKRMERDGKNGGERMVAGGSFVMAAWAWVGTGRVGKMRIKFQK